MLSPETIIATEFEKLDGREDAYRLKFKLDLSDEPEDGIVNGLHTMAVIDDLLKDEIDISENQYVTFTVITGISDEDRTTIIPFIAKGRNTVLQVKEESIDNLMGRFDTLKAVIEPMPYSDRIGWEESANRDYHVIDVLAIMTALNPVLYPNDNGGTSEVTHPIIAAGHKRGCLKRFESYPDSYDSLAPLLPDMLHLYDLIRSDARGAASAPCPRCPRWTMRQPRAEPSPLARIGRPRVPAAGSPRGGQPDRTTALRNSRERLLALHPR